MVSGKPEAGCQTWSPRTGRDSLHTRPAVRCPVDDLSARPVGPVWLALVA